MKENEMTRMEKTAFVALIAGSLLIRLLFCWASTPEKLLASFPDDALINFAIGSHFGAGDGFRADGPQDRRLSADRRQSLSATAPLRCKGGA